VPASVLPTEADLDPAIEAAVGPFSSEAQLPLFLTVPEVAKLLRLSRNSVYGAIRSGALPSRRFGWTLRIPRDVFLQVVAEALEAEGLEPERRGMSTRDRARARFGEGTEQVRSTEARERQSG